MESKESKPMHDLEDRFIDYVIQITKIIEEFDQSLLSENIASQLTRSSSCPALIYAQVQVAESAKYQVQKLKIVNKELKESRVCLKIAKRRPLVKDDKIELIDIALAETEELIEIIYSSIKAAKKKRNSLI